MTDWLIAVDVVKRKGTPLDQTLMLPSVPGGLNKIMTPRLRYPSRLVPVEPSHVVVRPAAAAVRERSQQAAASEP
jgi:protein ImuA